MATMALILPEEARENAAVWSWLQEMVAGNGPIRRLEVVDVRQSMANGGGPACLRLRVVADPATIDPRFLVDEARPRPDRRCWSSNIGLRRFPYGAIADPSAHRHDRTARTALLEAIGDRRVNFVNILTILGRVRNRTNPPFGRGSLLNEGDMWTKISRLFIIKTKFEASAVVYGLGTGAVERGMHYLQQYPGFGGWTLFAVCPIAGRSWPGARILDSVERTAME